MELGRYEGVTERLMNICVGGVDNDMDIESERSTCGLVNSGMNL